jgi:hypothetical protein
MYSDLRPLFDQIDKYYEEVNVSLRAEEHYLKTIRKTLRVTPDDKLRWQHIRNACQDACRLLAAEVNYMHHMLNTSLISCTHPSLIHHRHTDLSQLYVLYSPARPHEIEIEFFFPPRRPTRQLIIYKHSRIPSSTHATEFSRPTGELLP